MSNEIKLVTTVKKHNCTSVFKNKTRESLISPEVMLSFHPIKNEKKK